MDMIQSIKKNHQIYLWWLLITILTICGCSHIAEIQVDQTDSHETEAYISRLRTINSGLSSFKGIGKVIISDQEGTRVSRLAWMGTNTGKLRIEILGIVGQSIASFATDGDNMYFLSHQPRKFLKQSASDANLDSVLSIPINVKDIILLLSGKIPIREHSSVFFQKTTNTDSLVLINKWQYPIEKIYLDTDQSKVEKIEFFRDGQYEYSVVFSQIEPIDSYHIPFCIEIFSNDGRSLQLFVNKFWGNIAVSDSAFELIRPADWQDNEQKDMPNESH